MILGSTGSIGVQALEIVAAHPDKFRVIAMSAGRKNPTLLMEQAKKFNVPIVGSMAPAPKVDGVTVITAASSVVDGNAALLTQIDALNAKIVALNALIAKIMKKLGVK